MATQVLTGSRIRERRLIAGMKQAGLARQVGISAAYLNLIEHNRRRIGGKLLSDIATALEVDPNTLAEGAGATALLALRDAAADHAGAGAEVDRAEELAGRFPGWAAVLAAQQQRIGDLERVVAGLSDRLTHDPQLADALHELLSTATAIGSAASILVDTAEIEPEWRDRFHRNIHEDSQRLTASSQELVTYLEQSDAPEGGPDTPQDELEAWLKAQGHHIEALERALGPSDELLFATAPGIASPQARSLAKAMFARYRADAARMPLAAFQDSAKETGMDVARLAAAFDVDLASAMRRVAMLPTPEGAGSIGLVVCDASGTLTFRKPVDGFPLPRFGAACPLWPLYQALSRPMTPVRAVVETAGRDQMRFLTYAVAQPMTPADFDAPMVYEATMLILPPDRARPPDAAPQPVGMSCRICPRDGCAARREPSILGAAAPV
ncbi:Transcriptional regulator [Candidatus Rhodobacter oscarellae]|uniref:Transcriptional regulator n=1 Tax=Candidatus Rhodobacter oscarellae TaxID=1675527 RepID=A0A0J9E484_9RHOB|nr:helix-turn-helix transcriptional regulator [Candidatus Rhodobacter lobularis]KMW56644.1 Transcriptional regulator [Candidatus Rhodobacter lobularis]